MTTPDWFNVRTYGATGDGSTDDTSAINVAIAALVAYGRGVLYFPAGAYKVSSALSTLSVNCMVIGDGAGSWDNAPYITKINCTSQTAVLFTVSADFAKFGDIALANTFAGTPSSASIGIKVASSNLTQRVDYQSISVSGFYTNIDVQVGTGWTMQDCWNYAPVQYGLKIANTVNADAGDAAITNCGFFSAVYNSQAAIHVESSGGIKITNTKINMGLDSKQFAHGIELAVAGSVTTSILLLANNSFENLTGDGIHGTTTAGTSSWGNIIVNGCQFNVITGSAINLNATTAGDFYNVVIAGNVFVGNGTNAITLTKVNHVRITNNANTNAGFANLLSQTTCTDVVSV